MFGTHDLPLFVVAALVLNATPGADMLYTLTRTAQFGWRGGVAAALGIGTGCSVHAIAAAAGLAALLAASAAAFAVVKWAGALYLLWLAFGMARAASSALVRADADPHPGAGGLRKIFLQGLLTNVLNPKVALFFLALLPQFILADAPDKTAAFLFLGAIFVVNGVLFLLVLIALAHRMRRFGASPSLRRLGNALGAGLFAWLAARLALAER